MGLPAVTAIVDAPVLAGTVDAVAVTEASMGVAAQSIRVDSAKLDALMRLAGELLVVRGALPAFAARIEREESPKSMIKEMRDAGAKVSRLSDDLQATVMSIRMMPVRQVFQRFPRLVRDLARSLDKNIELHVSGEETELDKTMIDSIGDPLTHIIRNAADHGIESKADRAQKGKPALARIDLPAYTRGSNVVIEVKDDGKGLDSWERQLLPYRASGQPARLQGNSGFRLGAGSRAADGNHPQHGEGPAVRGAQSERTDDRTGARRRLSPADAGARFVVWLSRWQPGRMGGGDHRCHYRAVRPRRRLFPRRGRGRRQAAKRSAGQGPRIRWRRHYG